MNLKTASYKTRTVSMIVVVILIIISPLTLPSQTERPTGNFSNTDFQELMKQSEEVLRRLEELHPSEQLPPGLRVLDKRCHLGDAQACASLMPHADAWCQQGQGDCTYRMKLLTVRCQQGEEWACREFNQWEKEFSRRWEKRWGSPLPAHEDSNARSRAVESLVTVGRDAIPALIDALKDQNPNVQWAAAEALEKLGLEAKSAIPALIDALKD